MKKAENTTNKDYMELNFGLPVDRVKSNEELQDIARLVYNLLAEQGVSLTHREQEIPHFYKWGMNCD